MPRVWHRLPPGSPVEKKGTAMRMRNQLKTLGTAVVFTAVAAGLPLWGCSGLSAEDRPDHDPLPGTQPLKLEGDIASQLVSGVDRFLLREIDRSVQRRSRHWQRQLTSAEDYHKSIAANRARLMHITGLRDKRVAV